MNLVQVSNPSTGHSIHPSAYRAAIIGRRVKVSDPVARLMAEIIFGHVDRDHVGALPSATVRNR